ncbi:enoyl-CoA hydratase-related protein [Wenyingzhuangia sp. chi5]|uniref:Enoyl-CoA hydratase-related protein n=1 Tax=Wenyingzhuangia gilva TaxID=3057677 RepID=A0ABT8VNZ3_9FLAO|nr:enoyl-CoA hydratase-related protein [Wenyingzhuangia sp. chi5]MDO3693681.1 enoyl-CoA hydratase-related protein [Wenyingzhuangia sp. chi5]
MQIENIQFEQEGAIMYITINREKQLNAINKKTILELNHILCLCESDDTIRVLIMTGAGDKAFVAGADIKEFANFNRREGTELSRFGHELLFDKIATYTKPVIAAINGYALGGGLELALAAQIRIASDNAKMGQPEVTLGVIPGYGGTQRLTQLVGKGKAMELILTGEMISAQEALKIGMVNYVVSQEDLLLKAIEIANKIVQNSPRAVRKSIQAINATYGNIGLLKEIELFGSCFGTEEFQEGVTAFLEKRKPNF